MNSLTPEEAVKGLVFRVPLLMIPVFAIIGLKIMERSGSTISNGILDGLIYVGIFGGIVCLVHVANVFRQDFMRVKKESE